MQQHRVLSCGSAEELEKKLNAAARLGYTVQKIELIPSGLSPVYFAHMTCGVKVEVATAPPKPRPAKKRVRKASPESDVRAEVFGVWQEVFGRQRTKFRAGGDRDRKIIKALEQYSKEDIIKSIKGHGMNNWRHGGPVRNELATLLRNEQNIEAGMEIFEKGGIKDDSQRNTRGNRTIDFGHESRGTQSGVVSFD